MRISINILVLITLVCFGKQSIAQNLTHDRFTRFINYSVKDGLSNNTVNDIIQDPNGFMWFATEKGLSRFDGYQFVNFFHDPENQNSISGNSVLTLAIDNRNFLWIGTTEGLCRLNLETGNIERFPAKMGEKESPRANHIRKLLYSKKLETLWIESFGGTFTSLNLINKSWEHFPHEASYQPYYRYHAIHEDSKGNIWFGGRNTPIFRFDLKSKTIKAIQATGLGNRGKRDNDVADIIETSTGKWYVMGLDGIYQFFPEDETFIKIFSTSTFSVTEDNQGFLWFASGNGLLKFNPSSQAFLDYRNNKNNPHSLIHNHVNKVFIDKVGNIWAGTNNGISLLSQKSKAVKHFYHIPGDEKSLSGNEVTAIAQDSSGRVYIGTASNGLNVWEPGSMDVRQVSANPQDTDSLLSNRISTLYFDSKGILWLGLWSGQGFSSYNPLTRKFTSYHYDAKSFKYDWYNAFQELPNKEFIVGMWGARGATYFDRIKKEFTGDHFLKYSKPYNRPVDKIINDGKGSIFMLATGTDAIYRYSIADGIYTSHTNSPDSVREGASKTHLPFAFTIPRNIATSGNGTSYFAANKGIISWDIENGFLPFFMSSLTPVDIVVHNKKIYLLEQTGLTVFGMLGEIISKNPLTKKYEQLLITHDENVILVKDGSVAVGQFESDNTLHIFFEYDLLELGKVNYALFSDSYLWIGSSEGLFRVAITKSTKARELSDKLDMVVDIPVNNILAVNDSILCTFSPLGVYWVNCLTNEFNLIEMSNLPDGFSSAVRTSTMYEPNLIWVGSEAGHYQINIISGEVTDLNLPDNNSVSSHLVTNLLSDSEGNIWIGTSDKGLNRVDPSTGKIVHFFAPTLPSNQINAIIQSSEGWVWVATDKGICFIVDDFVIALSDISPQLDVRSLVEDSSGVIWAGANNGLLAIDPISLKAQQFDENSGFPTADFEKGSAILADGSLAFSTSSGMVVFDPQSFLSQQDFSAEAYITNFSIFGNSQHQFFSQHDTIKLKHNQNFFEISFSSSNYSGKVSTKYQYKLNRINSTWVESSTGKVSYTNIPPGRYLFQVSKVLPDGSRSQVKSSLVIEIKPAFWQTLWFKLSIAAIILAGISIYIFTYIRQLKAARLNVELEQRLLISQMNPHFIFNSLSAIQSFMYSNKPEKAGNYLSSFSRLVRLILENSRSATISVRQEIQTLELYLSLQKLRFPDKFDYSIEVNPDVLQSDLVLPPMLAQPFIENSIEHGIMHKEGMGKISVELSLYDDLICIAVEDNGVGIAWSKEFNQSKRLSHTSYATSITRERIKNISSNKKNRFGVRIIDLFSIGGEGTRVEIRLPILTANSENK